jgi:hypothetical protein
MWNYRRTLSIGGLVGKKFTDEVIILHRRIGSVGKTIKYCSVTRNLKSNPDCILNKTRLNINFIKLN